MTAFQTFQKMKVDKAFLLLEPFDLNNSCFCCVLVAIKLFFCMIYKFLYIYIQK